MSTAHSFSSNNNNISLIVSDLSTILITPSKGSVIAIVSMTRKAYTRIVVSTHHANSIPYKESPPIDVYARVYSTRWPSRRAYIVSACRFFFEFRVWRALSIGTQQIVVDRQKRSNRSSSPPSNPNPHPVSYNATLLIVLVSHLSCNLFCNL